MGLVGEAVDELDLIFGDSSSDIDAEGDTDEVGVFEFDSGTLVAVVEEDIEASAGEVFGDFFSGVEEVGVLDVGDGDDDVEGSDGGVESIGAAVVGGGGGLDGGGEDTLNADAVAAHDGGDFLAVAVEDGGSHAGGVLASEFEDVADFDGFAETERRVVGGAGFSLVNVTDVGDEGGFEVSGGGDVAEVVLLFVGTCDEVGAAFECGIEDDEGSGLFGVRSGCHANGAEVSGGCVEGGGELFGGHGAKLAAGDGAKFGLVEGVVSA